MSEIDQIKDRLSIVDTVSEYIELKRSGVNYSARCPFHNEKSPSFYVSDERGTYKCFGCGEGGDILSFVMYMDGLSFPEALKKLADKAGVTLSNNSQSQNRSREIKNDLKGIMQYAQTWYVDQLSQNSVAQKYLKKRGISDELQKKWNIGYAPEGWRGLMDHLEKLGYSKETIKEAGLIKKGEKGNYYDRFRERIMFPLKSIQGDAIAFSGRYIGSDDISAKYLNSPETPLFNKSRELYGISHAKKTMRKYDFACVVEGQIDLVLGSSVFANTVATSGTALTQEHLKLIKRFTDRVVFVFDGDRAGVSAAFKATMIGLGLDMEIKTATLPEGNDPADIIIKDIELYKSIIAEADLSFDFFTEYIAQRYSGREQTTMIEERLFPLLSAVSNPLEQDRYIDHMVLKLGRSKESIIARINQIDRKNKHSHEPNIQVHITKTPEKLLSRLSDIVQWVRENNKEEMIPGLSASFATMLERVISTNPLSEEKRFDLENTLETDILIQNEIQELTTRAQARFKQYTLDALKHDLQDAETHGEDEKKQQLLKQIQDLLHS